MSLIAQEFTLVKCMVRLPTIEDPDEATLSLQRRSPATVLVPPGHENRWPAYIALIAIMALQWYTPSEVSPTPGSHRWWLIGLETLFLCLLASSRFAHKSFRRLEIRLARLLLVAITIDNAVAVWKFGSRILSGDIGDRYSVLLSAGAIIFVTNIVMVAIWFWFHDLGGPAAREAGYPYFPDFQFPQYEGKDDGLAPLDWRPRFGDYLYVSFTNVVAFSPTGVMPLTRRAKAMMALQSTVAVTTIVLIIARAINVIDACK